jgi:two-component system response regulator FixJ
MPKNGMVHVIDDDDAVRDSLALLLESAGYKFATYPSAPRFLEVLPSLSPNGCIITDVRMPGMDGLALQRTLVERGVTLPIIVITGHGDIPIAVQALKAGAADFIEKPFNDDTLLAAVLTALEANKKTVQSQTLVSEARKNYETLTPREKEVLEGLLGGHPNKTIAFDLGMSTRTVEVHRARIMQKMQARSLSALVRMIMALRGQ